MIQTVRVREQKVALNKSTDRPAQLNQQNGRATLTTNSMTIITTM